MYLLAAALGYALSVLGLGLLAYLGALVGARSVGASRFRWFDAAPPACTLAASAAVRGTSVFVASLGVFALLVIAKLISGNATPTLSVYVSPGPAERAGLRDGDRIVSVDGKVLGNWDDLRREVKRRPGPRQLEVERRGERLTFEVTPNEGRISVTPRYEYRPSSVMEAFVAASSAMVATPRALMSATASSREPVELVGPVAVVKSVAKEPAAGSRVAILAGMAVSLLPLVLGVHLFDALTLALFRKTHDWADSADPTVAREARIWQTLLVSGLCSGAYLVLTTMQALGGFGNGALPGIVLTAPPAVALVLLVASAARLRYGLTAAVLCTLASVTIPCAVVVLLGCALFWIGADLRRRGYALNWFVITPAAVV